MPHPLEAIFLIARVHRKVLCDLNLSKLVQSAVPYLQSVIYGGTRSGRKEARGLDKVEQRWRQIGTREAFCGCVQEQAGQIESGQNEDHWPEPMRHPGARDPFLRGSVLRCRGMCPLRLFSRALTAR